MRGSFYFLIGFIRGMLFISYMQYICSKGNHDTLVVRRKNNEKKIRSDLLR